MDKSGGHYWATKSLVYMDTPAVLKDGSITTEKRKGGTNRSWSKCDAWIFSIPRLYSIIYDGGHDIYKRVYSIIYDNGHDIYKRD